MRSPSVQPASRSARYVDGPDDAVGDEAALLLERADGVLDVGVEQPTRPPAGGGCRGAPNRRSSRADVEDGGTAVTVASSCMHPSLVVRSSCTHHGVVLGRLVLCTAVPLPRGSGPCSGVFGT